MRFSRSLWPSRAGSWCDFADGKASQGGGGRLWRSFLNVFDLLQCCLGVQVSDAACKVQEDKNAELYEQISDMRRWYKDNLERLEQKLDLHLLATSKKETTKETTGTDILAPVA